MNSIYNTWYLTYINYKGCVTMAWEDGSVSNVETLIEAADSVSNKNRKRELLNQALSSAECIKNDTQRRNFIALIKDKLKDLN